ncbi:uncharacterized protein BCR38DRAFT_433385 [Pseudomassariella vexata]|uniref:Chromo domain-containing protein n=1 Tax=Pseudomassariella vexata TaxID=1141098 RepID=A0A1Y2DXP8_9PEZI|nr:uncharacterized protein BCR38DRAFT_433385 [Pseudomassariella vexata]ORY63894.1 hypothetical protein BCR38DRAFT_433385 [Pseudomassariella vexata]
MSNPQTNTDGQNNGTYSGDTPLTGSTSQKANVFTYTTEASSTNDSTVRVSWPLHQVQPTNAIQNNEGCYLERVVEISGDQALIKWVGVESPTWEPLRVLRRGALQGTAEVIRN